ncbi:MAG TPA: hypothetical protein VHG34_05315 [Nitrososphaeraceae archaeon]|nr:hypothetical protein [Nitrososphaeraceae archaeon]
MKLIPWLAFTFKNKTMILALERCKHDDRKQPQFTIMMRLRNITDNSVNGQRMYVDRKP